MNECKTCSGNGEIVTDWDRYLSSLPGDRGDEAVAECQDCGGTGEGSRSHEQAWREVGDLQRVLAAKDAEIAALTKERDFFHEDRNRLADDNNSLRKLLRRTIGVTYIHPNLRTEIDAALEMSGGVK